MIIIEVEVEDIDEVFSAAMKQGRDTKETNQSSAMEKVKGIMKQAKYAREWGTLLKGYLQKDKEGWIRKDRTKIREAMNALAAKKWGIHISDIKVLD